MLNDLLHVWSLGYINLEGSPNSPILFQVDSRRSNYHVHSEMQKERSEMRLTAGIIVLVAALGAAELWTSGATIGWGAMVGAGLGVIVLAWIVKVWLRNRQRRRLTHMRDSALW